MDIKIDKEFAKRSITSGLTGLRWALLIALPALVAGFGLFSGTKTGEARRNLAIAAVASAVLLACLNVWVEIRGRRDRKKAQVANENFVVRIGDSTRPLIAELSAIASAFDPSQRKIMIEKLVDRTLDMANTHCGTFEGVSCETRTAYYALEGTGRLARRGWTGRSARAPRELFDSAHDKEDAPVIDRAKGENHFLVENLDKKLPEGVLNGRGYKTLLQIPVRNKRKSFGFLGVDSDQPNSLGKADVSFLTVMAAILAAAFSLDEEHRPGTATVEIGGAYTPPMQVGRGETAAKPESEGK